MIKQPTLLKGVFGIIGISVLGVIALHHASHSTLPKVSEISSVDSTLRYTTQETLNNLSAKLENVTEQLTTLTHKINRLQTAKTNLKAPAIMDVLSLHRDQMVWLQATPLTHIKSNSLPKAMDALSTQGTLEIVENKARRIASQPLRTYTLPANTWLTGVVALQPLIGIIPVNGKVTNPRTVSFVVQQENLAANGWRLPAVFQGMQGEAVCEGFFALWRPAVTCQVTSLTVILPNGRIQTVNGSSLGVLTDVHGNPQMAGVRHSTFSYALAGTALWQGLQGVSRVFAARTQVTSSIPNGATVSPERAFVNGAVDSTTPWWQERIQSLFDYVERPNWDKHTQRFLPFNIKMTQAITIEDNPHANTLDSHSLETQLALS